MFKDVRGRVRREMFTEACGPVRREMFTDVCTKTTKSFADIASISKFVNLFITHERSSLGTEYFTEKRFLNLNAVNKFDVKIVTIMINKAIYFVLSDS